MSENTMKIKELLDDLSLGLVMVDPEDLMALGTVLEKIESVSLAYEAEGPDVAKHVANGLKKALENIILEKVTDKAAAMELFGRGVSVLQEIDRSGAAKDDQHELFAALNKTANVDMALMGEKSVEAGEGGAAQDAGPEEEIQDFSQDRDLFIGFIAEAMEHIESIEVNIVTLEQEPDNRDTINAVFRPFHTIKGVAGFLNLGQVHHLTHEVENLLDSARNGKLQVTPPMIDLILDAVDILKRMINDLQKSLETGQPVEDDYNLEEFFVCIKDVQSGGTDDDREDDYSPYGGQKLGEILVEQGLINEEELDGMLKSQEESRLRRLGEVLVERGVIDAEELEETLRRQMDEAGKRLGELLIETGKADPLSVSEALEEQIEGRQQKLGAILIKEKKVDARKVTTALREQKKSPDAGQAASGRTVKVDTEKLDNLVDLVGELVIAQSLVAANERIVSLKDQKLIRDLGQLSRITSELQRTAMGMRMVPVHQTFQKMIRLVRDLSRKSGKQVELTMSGEDTEIDRNMVEAIYDPMVHMVRNSMDHGMEEPGERQAAGKSSVGSVHLRAFHQGGNVVIEISDDGRGLNKQKILAKALERGLITSTDGMTDAAAYSLIFQAGFSTAETITDVSGRGVGMDVVKRAIEGLRGKLEVASVFGQGTTITIRLPLTLAIIDGMIVRVGEARYILPTLSIHESFRPKKNEYFTVRGKGEMIKVRETLLPLIRLERVLGGEKEATDPTEALVVVMENDGERRCVLVDEAIGKQEVVIKSLGEGLKNVRALAGGSILGDGRVGLILDVAGLFEASDLFVGQGAGEDSGEQEKGVREKTAVLHS